MLITKLNSVKLNKCEIFAKCSLCILTVVRPTNAKRLPLHCLRNAIVVNKILFAIHFDCAASNALLFWNRKFRGRNDESRFTNLVRSWFGGARDWGRPTGIWCISVAHILMKCSLTIRTMFEHRKYAGLSSDNRMRYKHISKSNWMYNNIFHHSAADGPLKCSQQQTLHRRWLHTTWLMANGQGLTVFVSISFAHL